MIRALRFELGTSSPPGEGIATARGTEHGSSRFTGRWVVRMTLPWQGLQTRCRHGFDRPAGPNRPIRSGGARTERSIRVHGYIARVASYGKVVGGHFMNATIGTNRKGELALQLGGAAAFKRRPKLTADTVAAWEEIISETRGGAAGAVSNVGQAVARAALPGRSGKAASAAVGSAVDSARAHRTPFESIGSTETSP